MSAGRPELSRASTHEDRSSQSLSALSQLSALPISLPLPHFSVTVSRRDGALPAAPAVYQACYGGRTKRSMAAADASAATGSCCCLCCLAAAAAVGWPPPPPPGLEAGRSCAPLAEIRNRDLRSSPTIIDILHRPPSNLEQPRRLCRSTGTHSRTRTRTHTHTRARTHTYTRGVYARAHASPHTSSPG